MTGAGRIIMGLDVAGNTGVAEGDPGSKPLLYSERFRLEDDLSPTQAFGRAIKWAARRFARPDAPIEVYAEGVVPETALHGQTNYNSSIMRIGLYACLVGVAAAKGIPVYPVNIQKYRAAFTGHGRCEKEDVMRQCRTLGWEPPDLDASDAAAVWFFGCGQTRTNQMNMKF